MSSSPEARIPQAPAYVPRPTPSRGRLLRDEIVRRSFMPLKIARSVRGALAEARDARRELSVRGRALLEALGQNLRRVSPTPLNQPIGPHRRFDWLTFDLAEVKQVRRDLGGSLNDVVLTVVTGAVRSFLERRGVRPEGLDFRILAPVSVRSEGEQGQLGNRVSAWVVPLPLGERDPLRQLAAIRRVTSELKQSKSAIGAELLAQAAEWSSSTLLALGARNATRLLPFNMVVTNVPGPQQPLYTLGARMLETFPHVPLIDNLGLGIALMSYDGKLCWGFNADYDLVPDLDSFVAAIRASFQTMQKRGRA